MNTLRHKEYIGSIEANIAENCLHGKLLFINDLITYEAETLADLKKEFIKAVVDYEETCKNLKRSPHKPFKGSLNVRLGAELHRELALHSTLHGKSLNEYIKNALSRAIQQDCK